MQYYWNDGCFQVGCFVYWQIDWLWGFCFYLVVEIVECVVIGEYCVDVGVECVEICVLVGVLYYGFDFGVVLVVIV